MPSLGKSRAVTAALLYVRVSTAEQVDNYSLATQERACREYCEREGLTVDRIFREEGESAKTANRTQLRAMLNYCSSEAKRRGISAVVIFRVDRLARAVEDYALIGAALAGQGIRVRSVGEAFDDSPAGKLVENLMAALAQFDNDARSARTVEGMKEALRRGRWVWKAPLGYVRADRGAPMSLVLDPDTAPLIRHGFEAIASRRLSKAEALAELTDLGLVARKGKRLSPQSFGEILNNSLYTGRIVKPEWGIDVAGDFEPLVPDATFRAVQAVLQGRAPASASRVRDNPDFPLRRVVRCGRCSSPLTGSWSTGRSRRYPYYRCPRKGCGGCNVGRDNLEGLFVEQLLAVSPRPEVLGLLGAVVEDAWKERAKTSASARVSLAARLRDLEQRRNRLLDAYLDGRGIDQRTFECQSKRLDDDEAEVRNRLELATPMEHDLARTIDFAGALLQDLPGCWNRLDPQHRPQFVAALYPTGLVYEDGSIGTTHQPWWMSTFVDAAGDEPGLAPPTGFEPVLPP